MPMTMYVGLRGWIGIGTCRLNTGHRTDSLNRDALFKLGPELANTYELLHQ